MADEHIPSRSQPSPTEVTPVVPDGYRPSTAITDGIRAPGRDPGKPGLPGNSPPPVPLSAILLNLLAQIGFALLVALATLVITHLFLGAQARSALGTSTILGMFALYVARSLVHWPIPKAARAAQTQLPPNVRPSESSGREVIETIVFVVVLVLLLKSFAAEAFVIPTGSMAETLYGYQKDVKCPTCGITFPVNCSSEVDPQEGKQKLPVNGCTCPNCQRHIRLVSPTREGWEARTNKVHQQMADGKPTPGDEFVEVPDPGWSSGDRVLVGKFFDGLPSRQSPNRLDVVVFKYPEGPQKNFVAMNYIKRLIGLPGETVAISGGDVYILPPEKGPGYDDSAVEPKDLWQKTHMHERESQALFPRSFQIVRKPADVLLSMMRLVYDNDHQPSDLKGPEWQRWKPEGEGWEIADEGKTFRHGSRVEGEKAWLRYRHLLRDYGGEPSLVTDFLGYNSNEFLVPSKDFKRWGRPESHREEGLDDGFVNQAARANGSNWVGDLILECEVTVEKAEGELTLALVRGGEHYHAIWDLASGECTLTRKAGKDTEVLERKPTRLKKGTYRLRFANVDQRLTVWVGNDLPFGDGETYERPASQGPTKEDLSPAAIGVKGSAVSVRKVKLFRDSWYTTGGSNGTPSREVLTHPEKYTLPNDVLAMYVQPGHYLCLGDNSPQSADSRSWGLVPERLMLGRALLVYWPPSRAGKIR